MARQVSERAIIFLVGAVQFVNVLDFMMVMPLGPDFASALGIPTSKLGLIGGSYTAAAAVAGAVGALFLDRFDRRVALALAMLGLGLATMAGGLTVGLGTLMAARMAAGAFGGPATSLSLSIVADVIPLERRGKAMGAVLGAFSVAAVLGVPAGLELARHGGWRMPFIVVGALGFLVTGAAVFAMPPMRRHLEVKVGKSDLRPLATFLGDRTVLFSLSGTVVITCAVFAILPNMSAYVQHNLGYPRDRLWLPYMAGGTMSFVAMRAGGALVDRRGSTMMATIGSLLFTAIVFSELVLELRLLPVLAMFVGFMMANAFRTVATQSLASRVPLTAERARFMSAQSMMQHVASAVGAFVSAQLLSERADGSLVGMPRVAILSVGLSLCLPPMVALVSRRVRRRESAALSAAQ
jgi:predicted MFS family arabinose efflux permease